MGKFYNSYAVFVNRKVVLDLWLFGFYNEKYKRSLYFVNILFREIKDHSVRIEDKEAF